MSEPLVELTHDGWRAELKPASMLSFETLRASTIGLVAVFFGVGQLAVFLAFAPRVLEVESSKAVLALVLGVVAVGYIFVKVGQAGLEQVVKGLRSLVVHEIVRTPQRVVVRRTRLGRTVEIELTAADCSHAERVEDGVLVAATLMPTENTSLADEVVARLVQAGENWGATGSEGEVPAHLRELVRELPRP